MGQGTIWGHGQGEAWEEITRGRSTLGETPKKAWHNEEESWDQQHPLVHKRRWSQSLIHVIVINNLTGFSGTTYMVEVSLVTDYV